MIPRRVFLRDGGLAAVGLSMVPGFLYRTALAAAPAGRRKTLVVVFQWGGADGLNIVVPFGEPAYYEHRPRHRHSGTEPWPGWGVGSGWVLWPASSAPAAAPALHARAPRDRQRRGVAGHRRPLPIFKHRISWSRRRQATGTSRRDGSTGTSAARRILRPPAFRAAALGEGLPKALRGPAAALALRGLDQFDLRGGGFVYRVDLQ